MKRIQVRRRRLVVTLLVVLVVLVAGGLTGARVMRDRHLAQQRTDYATGVEASQRADCPAALRALSAARQGGSVRVAAAAGAERRSCEELQRMQARTADQVPTAALISWIGYLNDGPPQPFQDIARKAARAAVESGPLSKIMTAPLCRQQLELAEYRIVSATDDPLAAEFLTACASAQIKGDPWASQRLFTRLRTEYPKQAAKPAAVKALGRLITGWLTPKGITYGARFGPSGRPLSLGGKSRLVVHNGQTSTLEMILDGPKTRLIKVKACSSCSRASTDTQGQAQCDRPGSAEVTITVPAGRYTYAQVDPESIENPWIEQWDFRPNRVYDYCWWTVPDE